MKKWLGMVFAAILVCAYFTGCGDEAGDSDGDSYTKVLTSIEEVKQYLSQQNGSDPNNPVQLTVKIGASEWPQLFEVIDSARKYIALDLSQSYNVPAEFNSLNNDIKIVSLVLPTGITSIGSAAFHNWTSLKRITLPEGVTTIGTMAFRKCTSLEEITLPTSLTEIGEEAIEGCTSLRRIVLPAGITELGDRTFYECTSLREIIFSASLISIGLQAFYGCTALREIDLPASLTSIGTEAFCLCSKLDWVVCRAETPPELVKSDGRTGQFDETASDLTIGVGSNESYNAYKAAWSEYADKIGQVLF